MKYIQKALDAVLQPQETPDPSWRPVSIYYEHHKSDELRPFHHAFIIVGHKGASKDLYTNTRITVIDRYGAKSESHCKMAEPEEQIYGKLEKGWADFAGWTDLSDEEIFEKGRQLVKEHSTYSIMSNNCADFAKALVEEISVLSEGGLPDHTNFWLDT